MLCKARQNISWGETCGENFFLTNLGVHTPGTPVLGSAPGVIMFYIFVTFEDLSSTVQHNISVIVQEYFINKRLPGAGIAQLLKFLP